MTRNGRWWTKSLWTGKTECWKGSKVARSECWLQMRIQGWRDRVCLFREVQLSLKLLNLWGENRKAMSKLTQEL